MKHLELLSRRKWLGFVAAAAGCARTGWASLRKGEAAPHFVAKTLDGERLTSETLRGKVILIEFWATWCQFCKRDEPAVQNLMKEFGPKGLVVLAVDMGEPRRRVKKFLEQEPRPAKVILAEDTTLAALCEATSYPLYVLIDSEGTVAGVQHGSAGEGALRRLVAEAGLESES